MIHLQNNAIRAANLVKYLLNMSRKNQTNNENISHLNLKIAELLRSMSKVISKNIEIKFKQDNDIEGLAIGGVFLEQILTNLLINSRDAIVEKITNNPNHKGLIYITTQLVKNYFNDNDGVKIIIYDNGKGIKTTNLLKIFDPFYTTKDKNGIGLGLATVKKIIEQHKGNINVHSQDNVSTEITIILPSCKNKLQEEEKSPYITGNNNIILDTGTILIVEDEQSIRKLLKEHLSKTGYKVLDAENATQALQILETYNDNIDLLISDVMLPDMSIVAMVKHIQKKYPNILIILSSGTTEDQVEDIIQKSFNYTFLNKPFPLNTIINTINILKNK
jgi:two-component system cell cycle sensor histidine kinase/response regulator CckA